MKRTYIKSFLKTLPSDLVKIIVIVCTVLLDAQENCTFKNRSMSLSRVMQD